MAPGFQVFKERYPNVKLNVLYDADHRNKLNTQIAADSAPDLFIHDVWSGQVRRRQRHRRPHGSDEDGQDRPGPGLLLRGRGWCGKTFAFPFYVTSMLLAYNKSLLQKWPASPTPGTSTTASGPGRSSWTPPAR